jgi:hypothetical protein
VIIDYNNNNNNNNINQSSFEKNNSKKKRKEKNGLSKKKQKTEQTNKEKQKNENEKEQKNENEEEQRNENEEEQRNENEEEQRNKNNENKSKPPILISKTTANLVSSTSFSASSFILNNNNNLVDFNITEKKFLDFFSIFKISIQKPESIFSSFIIEKYVLEKNQKKILEQLLLLPSFIQKKYSKELAEIFSSYFNSQEFKENQLKLFLPFFDLFHINNNKKKFFKNLDEQIKIKKVNFTKLNRDQVK